jgi:hypothetical protein
MTTVYRFPAGSVSVCYVPALNQKIWYWYIWERREKRRRRRR